jgi:hypothetical protein
MTSSQDRIWQRIHQMARQLAQHKSLPSARHAEAIVLQMVREENIELPDGQTVTSLADELRRATQFHPPQ